MTFNRKERRFSKGVRVRVDAPGWPFHGQLGTVDRDMMDKEHVCIVRLDSGKVTMTGSAEVARLRDQSPPEGAA